MILIVCAMETEASEIKRAIENLTIGNITAEKYYYKGLINKKEVALIVTGVGKSNAALMTGLMLNKYKFDYIVNIGLAGGFSPYNIGDVVVIKDASYHDVDVSVINPLYEIGQIPNMPHPFLSDFSLVDKTAFKLNAQTNSLYTGDQFITLDLSKPKGIYDMEGAAIYQAAHIFDVKIVAIKVISDIIDGKHQKKTYEAFEAKAATIIKDVILKVI